MTLADGSRPDERHPRVPSVSATTAVVLVGGLGTRLRASVPDRPKFLAPIAGRPFASYLLAHLAAQGVRDVVLCIGHLADQVEDHCGDGSTWGLEIRYSREPEPLGTGGALRHARDAIRSDPFLVLNGDSFVQADLAVLLREHAARGGLATLVVAPCADTSRFGRIELGEQGVVLRFVEKGVDGEGWINAGIYALSRALLDRIPAGAASVERDVFARLPVGSLFVTRTAGPLIDIGTPESLAEAAITLPALIEQPVGEPRDVTTVS